MRRGNTLIHSTADNSLVIGRKGLHKFFDLDYRFVNQHRAKTADFKPLDLHVKNFILAAARKAFLLGHKVEVLKTLKANGENAQFSWNPKHGVWIISSKNVAMLVRDRSDLEAYNGDRYSFSRLMATIWFNNVERIQSEGRLDEFKEVIKNKTLVAEYVGNPKF